ncbi:MAG: hypothetical protein UV68_C0057G0005 [Candidatus Collierbacteria bacterium GW2011_GWC2_43_12]|uniref:Peptidase C39 domain-containing protein n=1 Tax=Candidatus Collierbacteria bacterium GW2011_GWC2_43_12 TaxID=1618390 RepID=A0A0G1F9R8_9BACT|nr:MAG: hypothetical protein UV68_C0057G0005 [Candidatus Collierbacteria bacterium GW2011_GWC2_43_12]
MRFLDLSDKVKKMALSLKPVIQKYDYDCGGAAVKDLLILLGRNELVVDLYNRLEVNSIDGTKSQNIKKFFDEEKIDYVEKIKGTVSDLQRFLNRGYVCLVSYQAWGTEEEMDSLVSGHYSIVFDVDEDYVWLIDPTIEGVEVPGFGKGIVRQARGEFYKRWWDKGVAGEIYDHWFLAVNIVRP